MELSASGGAAGAPHLHEGSTTASMMWTVTLCLVPSGLWGIWQFGFPALFVVSVSIGAALLGELSMGLILRRPVLQDGSAFLTGLLVGYLMPPGAPLYAPLAASLFAVVVVKWSFGGLGGNWMNPALGGVIFALLSWRVALESWIAPRAWHGELAGSGAAVLSPVAFVAASIKRAGRVGPVGLLAQGHYPVSAVSGAVAQWLGAHAGIRFDPHYLDLFLGLVPGSIGEISAPLLLLGAVVLFHRRIIRWLAPVAYLAAFLLLCWGFGGLPLGRALFQGDPLFYLLSGGILLGAFYLAVDPVTSPRSPAGVLAYGAGAGALTFLFRLYGDLPAAMPFGIVLMNMLVPAIDRMGRPLGPEAREAAR